MCVCVCVRFVVSWVDLYYRGDEDVQHDSELQHWIDDINTHGFTHDSGVCLCVCVCVCVLSVCKT